LLIPFILVRVDFSSMLYFFVGELCFLFLFAIFPFIFATLLWFLTHKDNMILSCLKDIFCN
jgi:hypothetical protein